MPAPFLTTEWRSLAMLNYEIDPAALQPFVPMGTELDQWRGKTFVSIVGLLFVNTRIRGVAVPFHANFEELNLRFYVKRLAPDGWRRGAVFIKELVPLHAVTWIARMLYNENYVTLPMSHRLQTEGDGPVRKISYEWSFKGRKNRLELSANGDARVAEAGSCEEFVSEHYWGYARQRDGGTCEYRVEHARWPLWTAREAALDCDVEGLYGTTFADFLRQAPASAFFADGSPVTVFQGMRLDL
ncbi:MAG TPA: DUF2071 domain-containing protein [Candidatus Methylacidiphilales bacterium]|jgi:uncharacterized protein YqjF (DUF2071 family)|nr:DUF2071 domain-containing protein [Candidatus Methylacidiphilales bacterium]